MKKEKPRAENNQYGELVTATIFAYLENGKLIDAKTQKEVKLKKKETGGGVFVEMRVPLSSIPEEDYAFHTTKRVEVVMKAGESLYFEMDYNGGHSRYTCRVVLHEPLRIEVVGNKPGRLQNCICELVEIRDTFNKSVPTGFEPIVSNTLHQSFFTASTKFRPSNKSHNCNVFKTFRNEKGILLGDLRGEISLDGKSVMK
jgi:hypothetical protein